MSRVAKYPFFALFLSAAACNAEGLETIPHLMSVPRKNGRTFDAWSNPVTKSTTFLFARADDRDTAKEWAMRWAAQNGLDIAGIF